MKWTKVVLGDACSKIGSGATPKGGSTVYIDEGTSLIRSQNVYNLRFSYDGLAHITDDAAQKLNGVTIEEQDVLINITGDSVARTCVVPKDVLPARVNQHVAIIRPKKQFFNPRFLNYYFASPYMQAYMLGLAVGKGASRNAMTKDMIAGFKIPCPPVDIQEEIVGKLSAYDDLIDNNRLQIKLLEEAAQRLYKEWFVDLRFPGHEDIETVDGVPSGWEKQKVLELSSVLRRGISPTYNDEGKYTVINQKCIRSSIMNLDEARRQEKEYPDEINLRDADTVICSTGTGTLGRVGQVCGDYPETTIDSHVTLVRAKRYANLLYHSIKAKQEYLMGMGRGSTNQQELYRNVIEETEVLWPTLEIAVQFEKIAQSIHRKITVLNKIVASSIEARDRLLPKLMSGEIEL